MNGQSLLSSVISICHMTCISPSLYRICILLLWLLTIRNISVHRLENGETNTLHVVTMIWLQSATSDTWTQTISVLLEQVERHRVHQLSQSFYLSTNPTHHPLHSFALRSCHRCPKRPSRRFATPSLWSVLATHHLRNTALQYKSPT